MKLHRLNGPERGALRTREWIGLAGLMLGAFVFATVALTARRPIPPPPATTLSLDYTNHRLSRIPWSIHVVRWPRTNATFRIYSAHAAGKAVGLAPLTAIIRRLDPLLGTPVAAVNGDFYQRDREYSGDPRGLQIIEGEVISAPIGSSSFWIDAQGRPHCGEVKSLFQVTWPDGSQSPFGLNEERRPDRAVLYTAAVGSRTQTDVGRELVLEPDTGSPWLPLKMATIYRARVREIRDGGNAPVPADGLVLSLGPSLVRRATKVARGAVLTISTATSPDLGGVKTAISGGPVLVRDGKAQRIRIFDGDSYQHSSMLERHPRAAVGWSRDSFMLIEVDGRQRSLSVGMTLEELADYMVDLGCEGAMNLDGGGSATFWCEGAIRNSPCDGQERAIANSLIVVKVPAANENETLGAQAAH